jgi:hypothetical protein
MGSLYFFPHRNSASETVKQKLVFVGSEEGKLLAIRQMFQQVGCFEMHVWKLFGIPNFAPTELSFSILVSQACLVPPQ